MKKEIHKQAGKRWLNYTITTTAPTPTIQDCKRWKEKAREKQTKYADSDERTHH